jgi:hypothetical protein
MNCFFAGRKISGIIKMEPLRREESARPYLSRNVAPTISRLSSRCFPYQATHSLGLFLI